MSVKDVLVVKNVFWLFFFFLSSDFGTGFHCVCIQASPMLITDMHNQKQVLM